MNKMVMVLGASLSVLVAGCATTSGTAGSSAGTPIAEAVRSGFLPDYSKLSPVEGKEGFQRYIDRGVNLQPYTKLYIDPVQVFLNTENAYQGVQPDVMKRITDSFYKAFVDSVTPAYQVVGAPAPDVLRVRMAITGVQPVSTPLGVTDFIPIKAIFNAGRALAGEAPRLAELSAEIEVIDGQNRQVAAAVVTRKSDKTLAQGDQITWSDLSPIVYAWAKQFRQGLDDLRATGPR